MLVQYKRHNSVRAQAAKAKQRKEERQRVKDAQVNWWLEPVKATTAATDEGEVGKKRSRCTHCSQMYRDKCFVNSSHTKHTHVASKHLVEAVHDSILCI